MTRASLGLLYFKGLNRNGGMGWFDVLKKNYVATEKSFLKVRQSPGGKKSV